MRGKFEYGSILIITGSSLAGLIIIITSYDPYITGGLVKSLFFGSLILVLIGLSLGAKAIIKSVINKKKAKKWQDAT